jgi:hypothetical protein
MNTGNATEVEMIELQATDIIAIPKFRVSQLTKKIKELRLSIEQESKLLNSLERADVDIFSKAAHWADQNPSQVKKLNDLHPDKRRSIIYKALDQSSY